MCRRSQIGTYLNVNALYNNAQSFVFPYDITVDHSL